MGVTAAVADQLAFVQGLGRVFPSAQVDQADVLVWASINDGPEQPIATATTRYGIIMDLSTLPVSANDRVRIRYEADRLAALYGLHWTWGTA